jgi:hypothetical protein
MRRPFFLAFCLLAAGLAAAGIKPTLLQTDSGSRLLVLWRGQSGGVRFVNSVTGQPVAIDFRIGRLFQNFSVATDATTEAYYTHGVYPMSAALAAESTRTLRFCSSTGIELRLGFYHVHLQGGCLEARLLWTL